MRKCQCGNPVGGTLIIWYHDGCGVLDIMHMCADCGGKATDVNPVRVNYDDTDARPAMFFLNMWINHYRDVPESHQYSFNFL